MYRGRLWTMRQYAGFGTAKETNRRFKYLFAQGNEGLSVAFDLPTQMGYDSDAPMARGEVGRVGVAISTVEDMHALLDGLPLDRVSTSMTINATAAILLALYVAVGEGRGIARRSLRGTVQNDILKEYVARSTYIYPPAPSMRLALDVIEFCSREVPRWNAISVSGYHIREAGSTAAQEIGFTLANAIAYLEAAVARGLDVDAIAPQISFFFNAHIDLLEEVAKFRAARRLWASIMAERFHAKEPASLEMRFHAQTAGVALTAQQPENNAVRVAIQALAAVLGGAQSLHTNSMDEALSLPSEKAVRVALRTQQLLAYESGVANTVDPVGGSFTIESLTDRLEAEATALIRETDRLRQLQAEARRMIGPAHHVGIAVKSLREALEAYRRLGLEPDFTEEVPSQGVRVAFLRTGAVRVELLESLQPDGVIARFIERRGEGLHHLAFATADIREEMTRLGKAGFGLVDAEPRPGSQGRLVAFVHPRALHGVLLELVEEPRKGIGKTQHD